MTISDVKEAMIRARPEAALRGVSFVRRLANGTFQSCSLNRPLGTKRTLLCLGASLLASPAEAAAAGLEQPAEDAIQAEPKQSTLRTAAPADAKTPQAEESEQSTVEQGSE